MAAGDRIEVACSACGPVPLDPALVELHLDPHHSFALAVFLCVRCGRLGTSGQPGVVDACTAAGVPRRLLRCTSAPRGVDGPAVR